MSLTETSLWAVAKKQYVYKFKAYAGLLFYLVPVQIFGILSSLGVGVRSLGTASDGISITVGRFSADLVIGYTMIWAFVIAIFCTTKPYRDLDFAFVSNRLSNGISSIGFLLTAAIVGGVTASLSGVLVRIIMFFTRGSHHIALDYFFIPAQDLVVGILTTILYLILLTSIGYSVGALVQANKSFVVLLPLVLIIALRLGAVNSSIVKQITQESSLWLFAIKVIFCSALLFSSSLLPANKLEVRQ